MARVSSQCIDELNLTSQHIGATGARALEEAFKVNPSKTRLMRAPNRQTVTGLVVNNEVTLSRRDLKRMRAFFHQCSSKGLDFMSEKIGKDALSVARGYISYLEMVSPTIAEKFRVTNSWVK